MTMSVLLRAIQGDWDPDTSQITYTFFYDSVDKTVVNGTVTSGPYDLDQNVYDACVATLADAELLDATL